MHLGLRVNLALDVANKLAAINAMTNIDEQAIQLRRLDISMFGRRKTLVNTLLVLTALIHVITPVLLTAYFSWRLL